MSEAIINKVASSGLVSLDLADYFPREEVVVFDLKEYLFMGMVLKEKDFREALKHVEWAAYRDEYVAIVCSADAIIPVWAYMLVTAYLQPVCRDVYAATAEEVRKIVFLKNLASIDVAALTGQRVVVKGCGDIPVGEYAYAEITKLLLPHVKSIMYGEPCSTVPVYKKKEPQQQP